MTKIGLLSVLSFFCILFKASILEIFFAFSIAAFTIPGLYFLVKSKSLNYVNLISLVSGSEQILIILYAKENEIFLVTWAGFYQLVFYTGIQ